ncbi:MAG TPA: hypothetical protein VFE17_03440 [Candidatus Baltobacteraceae bacterium]|jgi:hypothetical protein|nr:hypothetical protein [Candidatus Baltobacteraceae bacterium]
MLNTQIAIRKVIRYARLIAILGACVLPQQTNAVISSSAGVRHVSYVIAYEPTFGNPHLPYTGWMQLTINNGIISGTYRGLSVSPDDPFVDRITPVTGAISGDNIHFDIGVGVSALSFNGRISGNWFDGTATWRGRLYHLTGEAGRPRGM